MTRLLKILTSVIIPLLVSSCNGPTGSSMEEEWLFSLEDLTAASQPDFDDSNWRSLNLPHDWAFENGFSETGAQGDRGGYACGGIGWYRKHFQLRASEIENSRHFLNFDAVYMNSEVWINGHYLGKRPYGYISFSYELTDWLQPGDNVISVRVDNSLEPSARWYHGCGIYGGVHLIRTGTIRFAENSLYITTPAIQDQEAIIRIHADIDAADETTIEGTSISMSILSPEGEVVAALDQVTPQELTEGVDIRVDHPLIWDIDTPELYTLSLRLKRGAEVIAEESERFGIRTIAWEPETGFHLNGRVVKLQGVCEHLEGGPVGAAWTEDLLRWKLQLLKEMGCNAIRTAHNPQLPFFYDICDEMGILVMDECFDGWCVKAKFDYGMQAFEQCWEQDLRSFLRRDRNHPCVVIWSLGNETRGDVAADLVKVCHEEDPSRLVTSGHSGSNFMDVFGVNGNSEKKSFIENYVPGNKAFVGTETPHTWQVRGYYRSKTWYRDGFPNSKQDPFVIPDLTDHEIFNYEWAPVKRWTNAKQHFNSSYDNATVRLTARHNIEFLRDLPWYSGSFRWTGFDYMGEAGYVHGGWPFRAFMGGALDMAGFPKDLYYLYQAEWTDQPMVHLLPHWTHPYMEKGTKVPVMAYSNAEEVELFVNGHSSGRQKKGLSWDEMACTWWVPWTEGTLEAVAYKNGREVARTYQKSAKQPSQLDCTIENLSSHHSKHSQGAGNTVTYIMTLSEQDQEGIPYPYGENRIYFHFDQNVQVLSLESGSPVDVETNWNARSRKAFFGWMRAFVSLPSAQPASDVYVGAILGDKQLCLSNLISIDVQAVDLETGSTERPSLDIRYTLDGSTPDLHSARYEGSFPVPAETKVKAVVYDGKEKILEMEESFGTEEGIHWETSDSVSFHLRGMQAEMLSWTGFDKIADVSGFEGECYLQQSRTDAELSFYQENDGSKKVVPIRIHYLHLVGNPQIEIVNNMETVASVELNDHTPGKWDILEIQVPLNNGANQIDIHFHDAAGNGVDWIELAE